MPALPPTVEVLPSPPDAREAAPPAEAVLQAGALRRVLLFTGVFVPCLMLSLAYVWLRQPVFQSAASVLTVAPAAVDQPAAEASVQHVAVQRQTLLGVPLLEDILDRLRSADDGPETGALTVDTLQTMLSVQPIPETNLVELRARGPESAVLAPLVNAWVDAYQALRERVIREAKDSTFHALQDEFERLGQKIETGRQTLDEFRRAHDILSKRDADNQAMARLNGLNNALNKAEEAEVQAKARLDAVRDALARGQPVVAAGDERVLADLEKRAQQLREQVKDLRRRFTPQYISLQPQIKLVPEQLRQVEDEIRKKRDYGIRNALGEAERDYAAARQSVRGIRWQLEGHKREAAEFTARFAEYEAMQTDLSRLEEVYRETGTRLARVEATPREKYPQLQVVDRAYPPVRPIWPNYWRDSGYALAGSLGMALLAALLYDYLTRREPSAAAPALPDIHVYSVAESLLDRRRDAAPPLPEQAPPALESPFPRELTESEIRILLEAADLRTRQVIGLLLSGLGVEELAALRTDDFDLSGSLILISGEHPRVIPLAQRLKAWLSQAPRKPAWDGTKVEPHDLAALVALAAVDSGLPEPDAIDAAALGHTYVMYLVKQGIRLSDLDRVVGSLPPRILAAYGRFSPPGPGLRVEAVSLVYPALLA
jgi:succinoglycan biosynthesis transport protein ExoP